MIKEFNITGTCYPDDHYMMDNHAKLEQVIQLIKKGKYFTINRPRQYGKTTTLHIINKKLLQSDDYHSIAMNFQGIDSLAFESEQGFAEMFMSKLEKGLRNRAESLHQLIKKLKPSVKTMDNLSDAITELVHTANKKLVLLIDEIDASSNYLPFLKFLAMLRTKYLNRYAPEDSTFHSIILAGVHDIKSLKFKLRNSDDAKLNSPWNIAIDFEVSMSFESHEIEPMLIDYSNAENVTMNTSVIAEQLYYYTSGYPFLVSKLCKNVVDYVLPKKQERSWDLEDLEQAVQLLLKENNTNFDSLIKNLENNNELYELVQSIILAGETIPFNQYNPVIQLGIMYGVFKRNGRIRIHNRIYEQLIYDYMTSKAVTAAKSPRTHISRFLLPDCALDMQKVLLKFQQFMKEQDSEKSKEFYEREGRVIFMAYLSPILNGEGYAFREVQSSLERRLDIIVTFHNHQYIIELKLWYGKKYHERGLTQLADYLDVHGIENGYLIIFDDRKNGSENYPKWTSEMVKHQEKNIFIVWV